MDDADGVACRDGLHPHPSPLPSIEGEGERRPHPSPRIVVRGRISPVKGVDGEGGESRSGAGFGAFPFLLLGLLDDALDEVAGHFVVVVEVDGEGAASLGL